MEAGALPSPLPLLEPPVINAVAAQHFATQGDIMIGALGFLPGLGCGVRSRTMRVEPSKRWSRGRTEGSLSTTANGFDGKAIELGNPAGRPGGRALLGGGVAVLGEGEGGDAGAALLVGVQVGENLLGGLGLLGENQLQVMAQGGLDGGDKLIRHADSVRERTEHVLGLFEGGERSRR